MSSANDEVTRFERATTGSENQPMIEPTSQTMAGDTRFERATFDAENQPMIEPPNQTMAEPAEPLDV
jgi:hypothetical protein